VSAANLLEDPLMQLCRLISAVCSGFSELIKKQDENAEMLVPRQGLSLGDH
jgi:hypothetical protein